MRDVARPFADVPDIGGFRTLDEGHVDAWPRLAPLLGPDYGAYPRGRVNWRAADDRLLLLLDPVLCRPRWIAALMERFGLPPEHTLAWRTRTTAPATTRRGRREAVHEALTRLLYDHHANLFELRHHRLRSALAERDFEHADGWFAIVAALAEVIEARAPGGRLTQCKEKFAALRVSLTGGDAYCEGAIEAAGAMTERVSELSGRPGRPMVRRRPGRDRSVFDNVCTLAPVEATGREPAKLSEPGPPASAEALRARHPDLLDGATIAIPDPCLDLADAWLRALRSPGGPQPQPPDVRLARLGLDGDTAPIGAVPDAMLGAVAFLAALGRRVDRATGTLGPVDDRGRRFSAVRRGRDGQDA